VYSTTRIRDRGQVTLPKQLRDELELEPGDELVWVKNDEGNWEVWTSESLKEVFGLTPDSS
jgi:AbrB family looped-hinge helix DNA binding protein